MAPFDGILWGLSEKHQHNTSDLLASVAYFICRNTEFFHNRDWEMELVKIFSGTFEKFVEKNHKLEPRDSLRYQSLGKFKDALMRAKEISTSEVLTGCQVGAIYKFTSGTFGSIRNLLIKQADISQIGFVLNEVMILQYLSENTVHIDKYIAHSMTDEKVMLALENVTGEDMNRIIESKEMSRKICCIRGILCAFKWLQRNDVVHGDISTKNWIISEDPNSGDPVPRLIGFRYASVVRGGAYIKVTKEHMFWRPEKESDRYNCDTELLAVGLLIESIVTCHLVTNANEPYDQVKEGYSYCMGRNLADTMKLQRAMRTEFKYTDFLDHPLLWSDERLLALIDRTSDAAKQSKMNTYRFQLERYAFRCYGESWSAELSPARCRYLDIDDDSNFCALQRNIRNRNHIEDEGTDCPEFGILIKGYLNMWLARFPNLVLAIFSAAVAAKYNSKDFYAANLVFVFGSCTSYQETVMKCFDNDVADFYLDKGRQKIRDESQKERIDARLCADKRMVDQFLIDYEKDLKKISNRISNGALTSYWKVCEEKKLMDYLSEKLSTMPDYPHLKSIRNGVTNEHAKIYDNLIALGQRLKSSPKKSPSSQESQESNEETSEYSTEVPKENLNENSNEEFD